MKSLDFVSLLVAVSDLLDRRASALEKADTLTGRLYLPLLRGVRGDLERVVRKPEARRQAIGEELAGAATRQDDHRRAITSQLQTYVDDGNYPAETRQAARRVRKDLKLAYGRGRTSYEKRARLPETLRPRLADRADDLAHLRMASGGTVGERVNAWLAESVTIDALLTERADLAAAHNDGADVATTARTLLRHMRTTLADERLLNPALPKNLDARVFGRIDALVKKAARRATPAAEPAPAAPTPAAPTAQAPAEPAPVA